MMSPCIKAQFSTFSKKPFRTFVRYTSHRFLCYWLLVTRSAVLVILGLGKGLSPVLEVPLGQPSPLLGNSQCSVDRLLQTLVYSFCFTVLERKAMESFPSL